eukprot:4164957-Amphidinium_carterae.1
MLPLGVEKPSASGCQRSRSQSEWRCLTRPRPLRPKDTEFHCSGVGGHSCPPSIALCHARMV